MRDGYISQALKATSAIIPYGLAAFGANRKEVAQASGPSVPIAGFVDSMGGQIGQLCDVQQTQVADAKAGGSGNAGDPITSDANGQAVKASKIAGQTVYCIGFAQEPFAAGDIFPVLISPFLIVG